MRTQYSDGRAVRLSVRPSVWQTHELWQNGRKIRPDFYTVKDFRGHDAGNCVFFLFGAVPNVCTVMRSGHVQQSDVNMIDRRTSAGQLAR